MMRSKLVSFFFLGVTTVCLNSCKPELNELTFSSNGVDFSKYVAIGSSFTAGYMDGALYKEGQENSYPSILAKQFKYVIADEDEKEFLQPIFNSTVGFGAEGNAKLILNYKTNCLQQTSLGPVLFAPQGDLNIDNPIGGPTYNNMGVPGMRSFNLDSTSFGDSLLLISFNPFYSRFATSRGNSTVLSDANRQLPSFFTFWLGSDDVLGYALAGADNALDAITNINVFKNNIGDALNSLTATGTKGAVANIPAVVDFPYFTTIPYNALVLTQAEADALDSTYATNNPPISFAAGNNPFVIKDGSGKRQMKEGELVLLSLPLDSVYCAGWGSNSLKPLDDKYVLTTAEINSIKGSTNQFNSFLKVKADSLDLAYVDMNAFFKSTQSGIIFNDVTFTPQFVSGGIFSLDGVHPNGKGYALVANEYIKAINNKYGCRIPLADVNTYKGITFP